MTSNNEISDIAKKKEDSKPEKISYPQEYAKYFSYLDSLRRSGITNMFGARPYLQSQFGMTEKESTKVLSLWMKTFSQRHPDGDRSREPDEDLEEDGEED